NMDAYFQMSLDELMNIEIVTAGKKEQKIIDIPASTVVIERAHIENMGYTNLVEILENIPGLYINSSYLETKIGLRGNLEDRNIMMLVNNVYQYGFTMNIPVSAIDRIEVVRGPMSIIYGQGAFLGVINIITNNNYEDNKYYNRFEVSAGNMNSFELFSKISTVNENSRITANIGISSSDGPDIAYSDLIRNPERLPILGVSKDSRTYKQLERDNLYLNISTEMNHFSIDLTYNEKNSEKIYFYPSIDGGSPANSYQTNFSVSYRNQFSDRLKYSLKTDYFKVIRSYIFNFNLSDTNLMGIENAFYFEEYNESAVISEANIFYNNLNNLDILFGLYVRNDLGGWDRTDIPFWGSYLTNSELYFVHPDENALTSAVFSEISYNISPKLIIYGGGRLEKMHSYNVYHITSQGLVDEDIFKEKYEGADAKLLKRLALVYKIGEKQVVKLLYGEGVRNPSLRAIYSDINASRNITKDNLGPEYVSTIELNYAGFYFKNKINTSFSYYYNYYSDIIAKEQMFNQEEDKYYWLYLNGEEKNTHGAEFIVSYRPYESFGLNFSHTLQFSEDNSYLGVNPGNVPNHLSYFNAYFRKNNFRFAINANYVSAMDAEWSIENLERQADSVPAHWKIGSNIQMDNFIIPMLSANLRISNILDSEIRYPAGSQEFTQRGYIGAGRLIQFKLSYSFE
ncbi:TonB-dependent receptor, partial [bacterium]|nr:TonB-dependent receptor [bacterium]